jgi:hypothetical protein
MRDGTPNLREHVYIWWCGGIAASAAVVIVVSGSASLSAEDISLLCVSESIPFDGRRSNYCE